MRTIVILSAALLSGLTFAACSEETTPPVVAGGGTTASGGAPAAGKANGGSTTNGGQTTSGGTGTTTTGGTGTTTTGGTGTTTTGGTGTAGGSTGGDQVGTTDPAKSIATVFGTGVAPYWTSGTNKGYCYTYKDSAATVNPPCGTTGPCFTATTGVCIAGTIVAAGATYANWGGGVGCGMNTEVTTGVIGPAVSVTSASTINFKVYGNTIPALQLQVGLKVTVGAPDAGSPDTNGSFCKRVAIPAADTQLSIPVTDLAQMCWAAGGPKFDPATMQVTDVQFQLVSSSADTPFDFCFSEISVT